MHAHDEMNIEELRAQLAEAQSAIQAIRSSQRAARSTDGRTADAEHAPSGAEHAYRVMIEHMQEGAVTLSPDGEILYCNRYFSELVGVPPGQLVGRAISDFVKDADSHFEPLLRGLNARGEVELRSAGDDGVIPVIVSTTQVNTDGVRNYCAIIADLRTQKYYDRLRETEQRLRDADRKKDEFLAMLGHELRNPLAPILHSVEVLHAELGALRPERLEWAIGVIRRQAGQMNRIIDDLLDIGRIARGQVEIHEDQVDLVEVVAAAVETARPNLEAREHRLYIGKPAAPLLVRGDANRLTQVVTNLLSNAIKYTAPGGKIAVELDTDGSEAILRVRDNGIGITPELLPHVFELFVQGAQDHFSGGGLGLGLNFVHRLVQLHGGEVAAYSQGPGAGSEFTVRLPSVSYGLTKRHAEHAIREPAIAAAASRVLVVDDNADAAEALGQLLAAHGFDVAVAYDGPQALETAAIFRPHVACLDLCLPGMDGFDVAKALRSRCSGNVYLVAVTGRSTLLDLERSSALGFDHCLVKPVDIAELLQLFSRARGETNRTA